MMPFTSAYNTKALFIIFFPLYLFVNLCVFFLFIETYANCHPSLYWWEEKDKDQVMYARFGGGCTVLSAATVEVYVCNDCFKI